MTLYLWTSGAPGRWSVLIEQSQRGACRSGRVGTVALADMVCRGGVSPLPSRVSTAALSKGEGRKALAAWASW